MNCQGVGDTRKKRDVFHYLRNKAFSINLLQYTYFEHKQEKMTSAEWGYSFLFASYNTLSRGEAILFDNNFEFSVKTFIETMEEITL